MFKMLRKLWKRWLSWSLPTKISIIGTIASVVSLALYFLDLRPFLERLISPPQVVRNISVRISNPEKTGVSLGYRDELVIWLPHHPFLRRRLPTPPAPGVPDCSTISRSRQYPRRASSPCPRTPSGGGDVAALLSVVV